MSEHDINNHIMVLESAIEREDEKVAIKTALRLVGIFLRTLNRIAEALENK